MYTSICHYYSFTYFCQAQQKLQHSWAELSYIIAVDQPATHPHRTGEVSKLVNLTCLSKFGWEQQRFEAYPNHNSSPSWVRPPSLVNPSCQNFFWPKLFYHIFWTEIFWTTSFTKKNFRAKTYFVIKKNCTKFFCSKIFLTQNYFDKKNVTKIFWPNFFNIKFSYDFIFTRNYFRPIFFDQVAKLNK